MKDVMVPCVMTWVLTAPALAARAQPAPPMPSPSAPASTDRPPGPLPPPPLRPDERQPARTEAGRDGGETGSGLSRPTITLLDRSEAIDPAWRGAGVVELEKIEVKVREGRMTALLTGAAYAHCYIGRHSVGAPTLRLVQPFEVTPRDPRDPRVVMSLSGKLDGYVRSVPRGAACLRLADAAVYPAGADSGPTSGLGFPPVCTTGSGAIRCERALEPPPMTVPAGRFVLVANLALEATVDGICNGHSEAVFAPAVRRATWDLKAGPFANVEGKDFGLTITLKVAAPGSEDQK